MSVYHAFGRRIAVWLAALGLLAGCFQQEAPAASVPESNPAPTATVEAAPTVESGAPAVVLTRETGAGTISVTRYRAGDQVCVAASYDTRVLEANHCGVFSGTGVGYIDTLTDPQGGAVRIAYGLLLDSAVSAVAVEFTAGGNANTPAEGGAYLLVLEPAQTPNRAHGVNTFGNLVGSWAFE